MGIAVLSILAIVLTTLSWANGFQLGLELSWNGLGQATGGTPTPYTVGVQPPSVTPLGIWVVGACVIALLVAVVMAFPALSGLAVPSRWIGGLVLLAAAAVPIVILVRPITFLSMFDSMGGDLAAHYRGLMRESVLQPSTLYALAVVLLLGAATCVAAALVERRRS